MTNAFQASQQRPKPQEDMLDNSLERPAIAQTEARPPKSNNDLVSELMSNLSGLANIDFANFAGGQNLQHLLKATSHLKQAQTEMTMAKQDQQIYQPEILRLQNQSVSAPGIPS